jgi:alpha-ketoglutarate-dependent taurine dioxygenase
VRLSALSKTSAIIKGNDLEERSVYSADPLNRGDIRPDLFLDLNLLWEPRMNMVSTPELSSATTLTVAPSTSIIGAEVSGVDLREPLTSELSAELRRLLCRHKVLFFRDQALDTAQQVAFCRNFGSILLCPSLHGEHPATKGVHVVAGNAGEQPADGGRKTGVWHIDASGLVAVPFVSVLRAIRIPPVGGDTVWANLAAAYDGLSNDLKRTVNDLIITHHATKVLGDRSVDYPFISHPLVRIHPETGEKVLYISFMVDPVVVGWSREESDKLVQKLREETTRPEYQVRFRWSPGAIAVADNRAVHHYAVADYGDSPRLLERVLITEPELPLVEQII